MVAGATVAASFWRSAARSASRAFSRHQRFPGLIGFQPVEQALNGGVPLLQLSFDPGH
jgi:hypothetical protein